MIVGCRPANKKLIFDEYESLRLLDACAVRLMDAVLTLRPGTPATDGSKHLYSTAGHERAGLANRARVVPFVTTNCSRHRQADLRLAKLQRGIAVKNAFKLSNVLPSLNEMALNIHGRRSDNLCRNVAPRHSRLARTIDILSERVVDVA